MTKRIENFKNEILKSLHKRLLKQLLVGLAIIGGIAGVSLWGIKGYVEQIAIKRISEQFKEPRIQELLQEVAQDQAKNIINNRLNPAIQKATLTIDQKINIFKTDLNEFKTSYEQELNELANEVKYLKKRNMVLRLRDKAISTGDAASLEKLEELYKSTLAEDLKMSVQSEILQVKQSFINTSRIKGIEITFINHKTGKSFKENEIPTEALIQALSENTKWQYRARAVELLKGRKEKNVPEALLNTIQNDSNLEVRSKAIGTFESITNFKSRDVLDFKPVMNWWNKNNKDVKLKELQTIQSVIEKKTESKNMN